MLVENLRVAWWAWIVAAAAAAAPAVCGAQAVTRPSDVIVLVQPAGAQAMLSVTFARRVPHDQARSKVAALAREAGWSLAGVEVEDAEGVGGHAGSRQTGVAALVSGAPLVRDGGFVLQPFLKTFADVDQFELLFVVPKAPAMPVLRAFRDRAVDVTLVRDGSPYRYLFVMKDHTAPLPVLPITEAAASGTAGSARSGSGLMAQLLVVVAVAAGGGLVVFLAARRRKPPSDASSPKSHGAAR